MLNHHPLLDVTLAIVGTTTDETMDMGEDEKWSRVKLGKELMRSLNLTTFLYRELTFSVSMSTSSIGSQFYRCRPQCSVRAPRTPQGCVERSQRISCFFGSRDRISVPGSMHLFVDMTRAYLDGGYTTYLSLR